MAVPPGSALPAAPVSCDTLALPPTVLLTAASVFDTAAGVTLPSRVQAAALDTRLARLIYLPGKSFTRVLQLGSAH
ncbi:putative secreted protein [Streptomyces davaonensis JCM 4913]|uniref:Putative secreted protein n=1 Tax=Streptomyces davaonensis (strain DSM 101723 / JCM 4913 / KCC S-0913 / 768) TaxID=1214101 RepID=K4QUS9_STRDJ|nr:hypothetical protein [Streptomyces davaonensis]CCK24535.1 putative secreted protein [Streptomyces davaonensis JCM 4913]